MTGFGCKLTEGLFTNCTVTDKLTVGGENSAGVIEMLGSRLSFGGGNASIGFTESMLMVFNATFQSTDIKCTNLSVTNMSGGAGGDGMIDYTANVQVTSGMNIQGSLFVQGESMDISAQPTFYKEPKIGNTFLTEYILNAVKDAGYATQEWVNNQDFGITLQDVSDAGYVTGSQVNANGYVLEGGSPSHSHTFRYYG